MQVKVKHTLGALEAKARVEAEVERLLREREQLREHVGERRWEGYVMWTTVNLPVFGARETSITVLDDSVELVCDLPFVINHLPPTKGAREEIRMLLSRALIG